MSIVSTLRNLYMLNKCSYVKTNNFEITLDFSESIFYCKDYNYHVLGLGPHEVETPVLIRLAKLRSPSLLLSIVILMGNF